MMSRAGKSRGPSRTDVSAFDVLFVRKWSVWGRYVLVEYLGRESCMELAMCWSTGKLELAHLWWASSSLELFVVLSVCHCISYGASLPIQQCKCLPFSGHAGGTGFPTLQPGTRRACGSAHCTSNSAENSYFFPSKIKLVKGDGDRALKC